MAFVVEARRAVVEPIVTITDQNLISCNLTLSNLYVI